MVADGRHDEEQMRQTMTENNDKGYILITVLLLLLVLTISGITAISTSTVENMLSGNIRLRETNLSTADAGSELSTAVIERAVREQDLKGFTNFITDANLPNELRATSFDSDTQDAALAAGNQNVGIDIDKMYTKWMGGSAIEFAAGYEGIGKSGGSGFYTFYRINSISTGLLTSAATVGTIYRYVPK